MNQGVTDAPNRPADGARRRRRNFTLSELVLVIIIASLLALFFFERVRHYQALAEQTAMEMTFVNMRSGLRLRVAELLMAERMDEVGGLLEQNPIDWLATRPPNYIGEVSTPNPERIAANTWYFDRQRGELAYVLRRSNLFDWHPARRKTIYFKVIAAAPRPVRPGSGPQKTQGVTLVRHED